MPNRRELLRTALGLPLLSGGLSLFTGSLSAQEHWPARTVTVVVPFPPGGTSDLAARPLAAHLSSTFGRDVVVENKAGAGGGIGHAFVARAEPDGYTILVALSSLAVIPEGDRLQGRTPTYEMDQFVPLARMLADPSLIVVKKDAPWPTVREFIAALRQKPGIESYGSSGRLGPGHVAMEMFLHAAGLQMQHVPYKGAGPSAIGLLRGEIGALCTVEGVVKGHLESGDFRVLAQFGTERHPRFPNAPTMKELGYTDVIHISWAGVFAPRKTPELATRHIREATGTFLKDKATVEKFAAAGSQVSYLDGPQFADFLKDDTERLIKVIRKIGV